MMKVHVACAQIIPILFQVNDNLDKMVIYIERIMSEHPDTNLIIFPELITSGYECGARFHDIAETVPDGISMFRIGECAKNFRINVIYGFPERDPMAVDILYNSTVFIDSQGKVAGLYRKVHLFDTEINHFRPGCEYPVVSTDIGKIGMMICWDAAFPEVARSYALQGAELLTISANWEKPYDADWDLVTKARAYDNMIYIAAANRVGFDESLGFFGRSKIIGPQGVPIQELNEETEGYISEELDYELPLKLKAEYYSIFEDRRPDTYGLVCQNY